VAGSPNANLELKSIDASANPYLLVGAALAAGLDGVDRQLRLPPEVTVDPATLSEAELAGLGGERLPQSLAESLAHLRRSDVLCSAMGPDLFGTVVAVRQSELETFQDSSEAEVVAATRFRY
jgi:glutamine synthetase